MLIGPCSFGEGENVLSTPIGRRSLALMISATERLGKGLMELVGKHLNKCFARHFLSLMTRRSQVSLLESSPAGD
jgi:hypothetical protein